MVKTDIVPWQRFRVGDFFKVAGGVVYAWKREDEFLYIGASKSPMKRLGSHPVVGQIVPFWSSDEILMWNFTSIQNALDFERTMIFKHKPRFNLVHSVAPKTVFTKERLCLRCNMPFRPKRAWQNYCSKSCRVVPWNGGIIRGDIGGKISTPLISSDPIKIKGKDENDIAHELLSYVQRKQEAEYWSKHWGARGVELSVEELMGEKMVDEMQELVIE